MLKAVMLDFAHTIMDELKGGDAPLASLPVCFMPGIPDILPQIELPMGVWANTRVAQERDLRLWLERARINSYFNWVVTSEDAGARKPDRRFFEYALEKCGLEKQDVLFVGNQLNTDIQGANDYGIKCVWLSDMVYRSRDDTVTLSQVQPTHIIGSLNDLPILLKTILGDPPRQSGRSYSR